MPDSRTTLPIDHEVARARAALESIDVLAAELGEQLSRLDSAERVIVDAIIDAAAEGTLATLLAKLDPGQRPAVEYRLDLVGRARSAAVYKLGVAEHRHEWTEVSGTAEVGSVDPYLEALAARAAGRQVTGR